jgi:sugar lactone lactonase YvrE
VAKSSELTVLIDQLVFPEGPRWREGKLWFSDMLASRVMSVDLEGRATVIAQSSTDWLSGLGWLPDGQLLVVGMQSRRVLRVVDSGVVEFADLSSVTSFFTNDMVMDSHGRAYVGEVGFDVHGGAPFKAASLVMVMPDGSYRVVDPDLSCPNGAVITPDGRTLIVAESLADRLTAYDIAPDGTLSKRRVWAQVEGLGPDGICLDADYCIWVASPMRGLVRRVREGGQILEEFATAVMPLAPMLGGPDRRTLFICEGPRPEEALQAPKGRIEMRRVDSPGIGLP